MTRRKRQPIAGYKVIRRPVEPNKDTGASGAVDFVVSWFRDGSNPKAAVRLYSSGSGIKFIWLDQGRIDLKIDGWFYLDEAIGVANALNMAIREARRRYRYPTQAQVDAFIAEHFPGADPLTHNRDETHKILRRIRRKRVGSGPFYVEYNGKWLLLCRSDLMKECPTLPTAWTNKKLNEFAAIRRTCQFGSRVTDDAFYIIDDTTDH